MLLSGIVVKTPVLAQLFQVKALFIHVFFLRIVLFLVLILISGTVLNKYTVYICWPLSDSQECDSAAPLTLRLQPAMLEKVLSSAFKPFRARTFY